MKINPEELKQLVQELRVVPDPAIYPPPEATTAREDIGAISDMEEQRIRSEEIMEDASCCPNEYGIPKGVFGDNPDLVEREYGDLDEVGEYNMERKWAIARWFQKHGIEFYEAVELAKRESSFKGWSPGFSGATADPMMRAAIKFAKHEKLVKRHGPGGSRTIPNLSTSRMPTMESKKQAISTRTLRQIIKEELDKILSTI